jgi:hypothetical protein
MADKTQRQLAVAMFNRTWELIDTTDRTAEMDREMLASACASRALWAGIGSPEQLATGDWQVAHVASLLEHPQLALDFASNAYATASTSDVPRWLVASTCEGLARAHAVAGHDDECDAWTQRAREILADVDDAEDRELIETQLATIATRD